MNKLSLIRSCQQVVIINLNTIEITWLKRSVFCFVSRLVCCTQSICLWWKMSSTKKNAKDRVLFQMRRSHRNEWAEAFAQVIIKAHILSKINCSYWTVFAKEFCVVTAPFNFKTPSFHKISQHFRAPCQCRRFTEVFHFPHLRKIQKAPSFAAFTKWKSVTDNILFAANCRYTADSPPQVTHALRLNSK